jgi:hypothetical protein
MKLSRLKEFVIGIIIILIFLSGISILIFNKPEKTDFSLSDFLFEITEDRRSISFFVVANKGQVELKEVFINDETVLDWSAEKKILLKNENTLVEINYNWNAEEYYEVEVVSSDDIRTGSLVKSPKIDPELNLEILNFSITSRGESSMGLVNYKVNYYGFNKLHLMLFAYKEFNESNREVFIFFDEDYMDPESIARSEAIIKYFTTYNVGIDKLDFTALKAKVTEKPKIILIVVNPLKDGGGRRIENALPAILTDWNGNGDIRDDSKNGKTILYDWMKEKGLVLVTVGSILPHKRMVYQNGVSGYAQDSIEMLDSHRFLTDAEGNESIMKGIFTIGNYAPVRMSGTLGLPYRDASFGFDKNEMEKHGLEYYAYGDYALNLEGETRNLTLPVFIRTGTGGWLSMGDEEKWLKDEQLAHDIFLIYLQAPWDSEWVPYGWYWDSGSTYYSSFGSLMANGTIETEFIPTKIIGEKLVFRLVGVSDSLELGRGVLIKKTFELETE